jgi:hypothetical protein
MTHGAMLGLEEHAHRLVAWLGAIHPVPAFDGMVILDTSDPSIRYVAGEDSGYRLARSSLRSVEEFAPVFDSYLRAGYSWINLSVHGLLEVTLVLGIERPRAPTGTPIGSTSVNYSGPRLDVETKQPIWRAPLTLEG